MGVVELGVELSSAMGALTTATSTISSSSAAFMGIAKKIELAWKDIEVREASLNAKEALLNERDKQLNEKEAQLNQREDQWKEKQQELDLKIAKIEENDKRVAAMVSNMKDPITINMGGQRFTTSKSTLMKFKGSFFESSVSSANFSLNNAGEFFVDHDPRFFGIVLNYIREEKIRNSEVQNVDLHELVDEFKYFKISPFEGGELWYESTQLLVNSLNSFCQWLPAKQLKLIFKASRDGFGATDFHKHCDNKGPTLTIVKDKGGYLFGGYISQSWESTEDVQIKKDPSAFIFTLHNPHNIPPTKYTGRNDSNTWGIYAKYGPIFSDFGVVNNSNTSVSVCIFPTEFKDTTTKGNTTFFNPVRTVDNCTYFLVADYEVYAVM